MNESWLLWGVLFGAIGLGLFVYGKRQKAMVPLTCGLVLMVYPYFVSETLPLVAIGLLLIIVAFVVKL